MTDILQTCDEIDALKSGVDLPSLWINECGDEYGSVDAREYVLACVNAATALLAAARQNERKGGLLERAVNSLNLHWSDETEKLCEDIAKELSHD